MDIISCILDRRSIRKFKTDPIKDEDLAKLIDSVKWAPSWANAQPWEVIIVRDVEIKKKLADCLSKGNPARSATENAPIVFAMCGRFCKSGFYKDKAVTDLGDWMMFDLGIASQNLCLAAHSLGLGTVHAGYLDHKAANAILEMPENITVVELIPVGYPDQTPSAPKRREPLEFVSYDKFGNK